MKLQLITDTHDYDYYFLNPNADLIIHAGDAGNSLENLITFHERTKEMGKPSLIVPGNHDYRGSDISSVPGIFKSYGINFLDENTTYTQDGITFVGGTLFTNFRQNVVEPWECDEIKENFSRISDFALIDLDGKLITPSDYITLFNKQYNHINQYRNKENVVVVTHFPPTPKCSSAIFDPSPISSGFFTNDLNIQGFSTWLFGHTHYNTDIYDQGCRLISNAYGYALENLPAEYTPDLLIEV